MPDLQAGFGKVEITPDHTGYALLGYSNRESGATGVHDPLWARALVLRQGEAAWALCSVDLCWITAATVRAVRERVAQATGLSPAAVMVVATHTHSGPQDTESGNWDRPLVDLVAGAIIEAWAALQPVRLAVGAGFLYGHSLNRRWFDRPVDPGVGVLRIDDTDGHTLGLAVNFGCHPVVMGADNYLISADYVGYALAALEADTGGICLFTNGGCADINPLTETVRRQLAERRAFTTMVPQARYYGQGEREGTIAIGNRRGGAFAEAEVLGLALAAEVSYVAQGLVPAASAGALWSTQTYVNHLDEGGELIETQAFGVADFALIAQPGEAFVESALAVKAALRRRGFHFPWLVSYANDWQLYLSPAPAFPEGGYEVQMAQRRNHSPVLQERLQAGIGAAIDRVLGDQ